MASRGRPKLGDKPMTSSERRKLWVKKMRNDDGASPDQPKRTPVEIFLNDEARDVLRQARLLAKGYHLPPLLDSELVERLLIWHADNADRDDRVGLSIKDLKKRYEVIFTSLMIARADLKVQVKAPVIRNIRTVKQVLKTLRNSPPPEIYAQEFRRRNNASETYFIDKLINDIRPLFQFPMKDSELRSKLRRQIEFHIDRLFGLDGTR
jgi:hypothetical protein